MQQKLALRPLVVSNDVLGQKRNVLSNPCRLSNGGKDFRSYRLIRARLSIAILRPRTNVYGDSNQQEKQDRNCMVSGSYISIYIVIVR